MAEPTRIDASFWQEESSPRDAEDASTHTTTQRLPTPRIGDKEDRRRDPAESPSDVDDSEDTGALDRTKSTRSIAETLPWYRELLFVAVICLGQLFTRKSRILSDLALPLATNKRFVWSRGGTGPGLVDNSYHRLHMGPSGIP